MWSYEGAWISLLFGGFFLVVSLLHRKTTSSLDAWLESPFVWGSRAFKKSLYPLFGRSLFYMSYIFTAFGILMLFVALAFFGASILGLN